ncbi:epocide hydrolase domain-containing protein, partial [Reticulomyxa filosa]
MNLNVLLLVSSFVVIFLAILGTNPQLTMRLQSPSDFASAVGLRIEANKTWTPDHSTDKRELVEGMIYPFTPEFVSLGKSTIDPFVRQWTEMNRPEPEKKKKQDSELYTGVESNEFAGIMNYWHNNFDYEAIHNAIFAEEKYYTHHVVQIKGLKIHFVHHRAKTSNTKAILLLHGWPSSFYEYSKFVLPWLAQEEKAIAGTYDIVIPSLPGFVFSEYGDHSSFQLVHVCEILRILMEQ